MRRAFTLIELLIVVAIIAILAAIALPNFLEAQTRAKVSRARADLRTLAGALEMYRVDSNTYPPASGVGVHASAPFFVNPVSRRLIPLTTPIAYISSVPDDPFPARTSANNVGVGAYDTYDYVDLNNPTGEGSGVTSGAVWRLVSAGPDTCQAYGGRTASDLLIINDLGVDYDPTNGSISAGDLVRVGAVGPTANGLSPLDPANPQRPGILRVPSYREQYP